MRRGAVHCTLLGLAVGLLPQLARAQDDSQEKRGIEHLDEKKTDVSLGYGSRHALVIGIDDYQDAAFPDLKHAVRDAEGVAKVLIEKLGFPEENVRLLALDLDAAIGRLGLGPEELEHLAAVIELRYKSTIFHLDRLFGEVLRTIEEHGLLDRASRSA